MPPPPPPTTAGSQATDAMDEDAAIAKFLENPTQLEDFLAEGAGESQEKADDAIDFGDISDDDDDLPDEEEPAASRTQRADTVESEGSNNSLMDLAAEGAVPSSPHPPSDHKMMDVDDDLFGDQAFDDLFGNSRAEDLQALAAEDDNKILSDAVHSMFRDVDFQGTGLIPPMPILEPEEIEKEPEQEHTVFDYFPLFQDHAILPYLSMFPPKPAYYPMRPDKQPKALFPTKLNLDLAPSTESTWRSNDFKSSRKSGMVYIEEESEEETELPVTQAEKEEHDKKEAKNRRNIELATTVWDIDSLEREQPPRLRRKAPFDEEAENPAKRRAKLALMPRFIDMGEDIPDVAEPLECDPQMKVKVVLDLNDPYLLVDVRKSDDMRKARRIGGEFIRQKINKDLTQRYNISNDEAYDLLKENHQSKVRSTIGNLEIEHTMPAVRLQTPYYKTQLSKPEMRSFHRPRLTFPVETEIRFTKGKTLKRKHFKGKTIKEIFADTKSLSLSDNSNFILFEYSEEHPYVLSNFGMGSRIINYYRRKEDADETRPKCELGELQVLMSQDKSPFWNFGSIDPGEIVPALYNRMVRAPVFKHNPAPTDFLVVRNTDSGGAYYYLRTIPHLFIVGQTFPVTDVPGPHSRKVTTASKNRMKMITYRVIRKKGNRIAVKDIDPHFPENKEIQTRQKMKEFMSHQNEKDSERSGYWYVKGTDPIPEESTIRTMVTPESVCLLDAMQVGGLYLEDAGYGKAVDEDEKEGMSTEEKLAPWIATKNFINATQGKAMLQLHGEGDPTGRGEAFSFIKTSMKGGFKAIGESVDEKLDAATLKLLGGHSYNVARQQKAYEETIEKIWRAQEASLKSEEQPELDPDELQDATQEDPSFGYDEGRTPYSESMTPATGMANNNMDDETASQFSKASGRNTGGKILRISRKYRNADGTMETRTEIINDQKVISMYISRKQEMKLEKLKQDITNLKPTGDATIDAQQVSVLQVELARLLRNKERRQARERQNEKKRKQLGIDDDGTPKGGTTRKCANCGMVGHIKTNKKLCPMLNGTMGPKPDGAAGGTAPGTPAPA
ncbi:hypothetical protein H072_1782 [Dactylellina haptotyla CBS 200.50]|uniref:Transcription initiation factor TFIID subunit 1 histone acetyltransferase domain-containing protein n=1 Tax=Dactylellina haptotyla (strain CBS 200.50) TaxID=1284197 RepID=S8AMR5_DACHA|nr:hypothetical protein H072_1782 [Dactylellina haptotyla CBS 200.50]